MLKDDPSTGIRGHLILIANVIRLTVDEQHANDYVPQLVDSYAEWKDFVVELMYVLMCCEGGAIVSILSHRVLSRPRQRSYGETSGPSPVQNRCAGKRIPSPSTNRTGRRSTRSTTD